MAHEWITAATALRYLSDESDPRAEQRAICERAHSGLIASKADMIVWNGEEHRNSLIPKEFWWAEGEAALEQNWSAGDFTTWIEREVEAKAFGVCFDYIGLSELASPERRAIGMQRISVAGDENWIPARELFSLVSSRNAITKAGAVILEASALGQLSARAIRAKGTIDGRFGNSPKVHWIEREWDVPLWFWSGFTQRTNLLPDWSLGKVRGTATRPGSSAASESIELQGLHFHRTGLALLGLPLITEAVGGSETGSNRGRRAKYDWATATAVIWGRIFRAELIPETQADIERALQAQLGHGDHEPSESTVRPFAKPMWEEFKRD